MKKKKERDNEETRQTGNKEISNFTSFSFIITKPPKTLYIHLKTFVFYPPTAPIGFCLSYCKNFAHKCDVNLRVDS